MEIVKRLDGSEDSEYDFQAEELKQEKDHKRKKGFLLTLITLGILAALGYFGFKTFNAEITKMLTSKEEVSKEKTISPRMQQVPEEPNVINVETKKELPEPSLKTEVIENKPNIEVSTYTEVLAQAHEPKKVEVSLTKVKVQKEVSKKEVSKKEVEPKDTVKKIRTIIVKKGDTLALIAKRYYGNSMEFNKIVRANKSIKSHKTPLRIGQKIYVPK